MILGAAYTLWVVKKSDIRACHAMRRWRTYGLNGRRSESGVLAVAVLW